MNRLFTWTLFYLNNRFKIPFSNGYTLQAFKHGETIQPVFMTNVLERTDVNLSSTETESQTLSGYSLTENFLLLRLKKTQSKKPLNLKLNLSISSMIKAVSLWLHGLLNKSKKLLNIMRKCQHNWSYWESSKTKSRVCITCGIREVMEVSS